MDLSTTFGEEQGQILNDISGKLQSLEALGLGYLNINRQSRTLSGGELQRVLLSTHLKGGLSGLTYVLDEPSTGLHPSDAQKLNNVIRQIVNEGNTLLRLSTILKSLEKQIILLKLAREPESMVEKLSTSGSIDEIKHSSSETAKLFQRKNKNKTIC